MNTKISLSNYAKNNIEETLSLLTVAAQEVFCETSENFDTMKNKKWYNRLWELITFSKNNEKMIAKNITSLSKLQEIITRALLLVSQQSAELSSDVLNLTESTREMQEKLYKLAKSQTVIANELLKLKYGATEKELQLKDLTDNKKYIVIGIYANFVSDKTSTEDGMRFNSLILQHANVTIPDSVPYSSIELLNTEEQLLLFRLMEIWTYLNNGTFDYTSDDVFDEFSISNKIKKNICERLEHSFRLQGKNNFMEFFEKNNSDIADTDFSDIEFSDEENYDTSEYIPGLYINSKSHNCDIAKALLNRDLTDISFDTMQNINTATLYKEKNIRINGTLICNNEVVFENCIINYETESGGKLEITNRTNLVFRNCYFKCNKIIKDSEDTLFFSDSDNNIGSVAFENCYFDRCQNLMYKINLNNVTLKHSIIAYPLSFINLENSEKFLTEDNKIIIDNTYKESERTVFYVSSSIHKNNLFIGIDGEESEDCTYTEGNIVNGLNSTLENCTFYNLEKCVESVQSLDYCEFISCKKVVNFTENINSCIFYDCSGEILYGLECNVFNCQFINCKGSVCNNSNTDWIFTSCQFKHHDFAADEDNSFGLLPNAAALIVLGTNPYHQDYHSTIKNCVFDDINLGNKYIAECQTNKKVDIPALYIENCTFKNIHSTRSDKVLIKKTASFSGFLGDKYCTTVSVSRCTGIDCADNKGLSNIIPKPEKIVSNEITIGADYTDNDLSDNPDAEAIAFAKPDEADVYNRIANIIGDFLSKNTCAKNADEYSEESINKIFRQFGVSEEFCSTDNLLGLYDGTVSLKKEFSGDYVGILFLKDRFYFKKMPTSPITGMEYSNIKTLKQSMMSLNIYGKDANNLVLNGGLYATDELNIIFYRIKEQVNRL